MHIDKIDCMDSRHHHLVSHHRNMEVEVTSRWLGGCRHDESESGYDVDNPYTDRRGRFIAAHRRLIGQSRAHSFLSTLRCPILLSTSIIAPQEEAS